MLHCKDMFANNNKRAAKQINSKRQWTMYLFRKTVQGLREEVSELLPHMKGMENVGVAPGEPLGWDLAPLHLVYLLVHPATLTPHLQVAPDYY